MLSLISDTASLFDFFITWKYVSHPCLKIPLIFASLYAKNHANCFKCIISAVKTKGRPSTLHLLLREQEGKKPAQHLRK